MMRGEFVAMVNCCWLVVVRDECENQVITSLWNDET